MKNVPIILFFIGLCFSVSGQQMREHLNVSIITDTCRLSSIPLSWEFSENLIVVTAILHDSTKIVDTIKVFSSYNFLDNENFFVNDYETLFGTFSTIYYKKASEYFGVMPHAEFVTFSVSDYYPAKN